MKQKRDIFFEVKLNTETFDIITGSMDFYEFLANRLYFKFDLIVDENQRESFRKRIKTAKKGECFSTNIYDSRGNLGEMMVYIKSVDGRDTITLQFGEMIRIYKELIKSQSESLGSKAILSQLGNFYYAYDRIGDKITCVVMNPTYEIVLQKSLNEWIRQVERKNGTKIQGMSRFIEDLRAGIRDFKYLIPGKIFFDDEDSDVMLYGTAVYENGVHTRTLGNVNKVKEGYFSESVRRDQLTGLILKEDITAIAKKRIDSLKKPTSIAIIDIDDFKNVNDNYGHMKGDEVLGTCASIIGDVVEGIGYAGRIGGDEFFIVFDYLPEEDGIRNILRSIKNSIGSAYSVEKDGFRITASIGSAAYPVDVDNFNELFLLADYLLYLAKDKGKNRYILYTPEKLEPVKDILKHGIVNRNMGIESRKGMSKGEIICKIADKMITGEGYSVKNIFNEVVDYFGVERIILYSLDCREVVLQCGNNILNTNVINKTKDYILDERLHKMYNGGVLVINNIKIFDTDNHKVYEKLKKQGVLSFMHHEIVSKSNERYIVSYESVITRNTWSEEDMYFFRILDYILAACL